MTGEQLHLASGGSVIALCGGVGGAKLAFGLSRLMGKRLTIIVNTGDDFRHLGLHVSPDIDTVLYTLSGLADREKGWGRADESWNFMQALGQFGGEDWFNLGDRDLALHLLRTQALAAGITLTAFTEQTARRLGLRSAILPMCDDPVQTFLKTSEGLLPFQRYFVQQRCVPRVEEIFFRGADAARLSPEAEAAFGAPDLGAIIVCPSNPYLSIDPLLAVPTIREHLRSRQVPCVAVSPLVGGRAVKGPTVKIMDELGLEVSNGEIARHYHGLIDGLMIDEGDAEQADTLPLAVATAPTLMRNDADRVRLAGAVLEFARGLATAGSEARRAAS